MPVGSRRSTIQPSAKASTTNTSGGRMPATSGAFMNLTKPGSNAIVFAPVRLTARPRAQI